MTASLSAGSNINKNCKTTEFVALFDSALLLLKLVGNGRGVYYCECPPALIVSSRNPIPNLSKLHWDHGSRMVGLWKRVRQASHAQRQPVQIVQRVH